VNWPARLAQPGDHAALAALWHQGWHDGHGAHTPAAVVAARTAAYFRCRVPDLGDGLRVAGPDGQPLGMCLTDGDEIDLLFVAPAARGTGLAGRLLADGESRLRAAGITEARLVCVTGNQRAMRFYIRSGWHPLQETAVPADGFDPPVMLDVTTFGKNLNGQGQGKA
jgi:GNAT superfamily N-acetyltransferase